MDKKDNWFVKDYADEDKEKVFQLRYDVYGEPFDSAEWEWKFKRSTILVAMNDKDEAVGIRPTIIMNLKYYDQVIKAGMNVDVMTHPQYQRRGIFSTLVKKSYNKLKKSDVNFVYTFPNEQSFPGYERSLHWTKISTIPLLIKPVNMKNLLSKYIKNNKVCSILSPFVTLGSKFYFRVKGDNGEDLDFKRINNFNKDFDTLWEKISSQYNICVIRNHNYLNWRYCERPGYEYNIFAAFKQDELIGYIVTRKDNMFGFNLGIIVDILAINEVVTKFLIKNAFESIKNQVDVVGCLMLEHVTYYNALKELGFREIPKRFSPKDFYFVGKFEEEIYSVDDYLDKKWFVTFGDIDIA